MYDVFNKPELTGSLIFRDASMPRTMELPPGKKLMLVMGVVAVDETFQIPGESFVRVRAQGQRDAVHMQVEPTGVPLDPKYAGWNSEDIFNEPIWKV